MSFKSLLKDENPKKDLRVLKESNKNRGCSGTRDRTRDRTKTGQVNEKEKTPEEILRGAGFKIRLITKTAFGTQIDLAKSYDEEEISKILSGFNIKIKDKSIFVVE